MSSGKNLTLGLDTSASPLLVTLTDGVKTFSARRKGVKQERLLFPALEAVLAKFDAKLPDIKTVLVIRGPGRFTGIRISLTFASMMQTLNQARVCGVTMFEVIGRQAAASKRFLTWKKNKENGVLAVVLHAFREEYFLQFFDAENSAPMWLSREELLKKLAAYSRPLFVAGSDKEGVALDEILNGHYTQADDADCVVRPATLLEMARGEQYALKVVEPLYLKPARYELIEPK